MERPLFTSLENNKAFARYTVSSDNNMEYFTGNDTWTPYGHKRDIYIYFKDELNTDLDRHNPNYWSEWLLTEEAAKFIDIRANETEEFGLIGRSIQLGETHPMNSHMADLIISYNDGESDEYTLFSIKFGNWNGNGIQNAIEEFYKTANPEYSDFLYHITFVEFKADYDYDVWYTSPEGLEFMASGNTLFYRYPK